MDEDDEFDEFAASREERSRKKKRKGHEGRHHGGQADWFAGQEEEEDGGYDNEPRSFQPFPPKPYQPYQKPYQTKNAGDQQTAPFSQAGGSAPFTHHEHRFGPNTLEFNHVKIDFDGVASLLAIQNYHEGLQTFGIKFLFTGDKGLYRIIWYGPDKVKRDADYAIAAQKQSELHK